MDEYDEDNDDVTDPKLVKPEWVDEEDDVEDEITKDGHDHQRLPANQKKIVYDDFLPPASCKHNICS